MKFINLSKFTNALTRKEKNNYAAVNEKRKTEESWTLFYNRLFYKGELENGKLLRMLNYNIYFKNNFNRLVNEQNTKTFSLRTKCTYN